MKVIGLCGGSGSGKGVVSSIFSKLGIPSVDTDAVYRELTSKDTDCLKALAAEFGEQIITDEGTLNRRVLADLVFSGDEAKIKLKRLNEIAHEFILDETRRRLHNYAEQGFIAAIVDAPVLFESGFDRECDLIVAVTADREIRIKRIMKRDGIKREEAVLRLNSQLPDEIISAKSDIIILNNSDMAALEKQVRGAVKIILEK